ncbi:MAG: pitrilysin family protein [Candidatus Cloacimonadota bacterium]|nr:pitrilysin family protein [Candidatus Cloacimonadota bacterium]
MKVTSNILHNEFKIITAKDNSNPLVCLQLYIRIGSAWEEKNEAGYSHLTEHLVFKSTKAYPQNAIMNKVTNLGGSINAYTEFDSTCFYITLPSKFTEEGIEILSELVLKADFSNEDFSSEKKVVIEELKQFKNEPEDSFIEDIAADYFKKNPYKKPIIGNMNSLKKADPDSLRNFYNKYYVPNNCFLVAAGDIKGNELDEVIKKYFSKWKPSKLKERKRMSNHFPTKPEIKYFAKDISSNMLAFVIPDLAETDPDAYPLSLVTKAFAIGKNSRLYTRLFTQEKLIDNVHVHSLSGINDGASVIVILPKRKADLTKISKIFMEELKQFFLHGMNDIELEDNKKELIYFYRYTFEYMESLASSLGSEEILSNYKKFFEYPEMIRNITSNDIKRIIKNYFSKEHLYIYCTGKNNVNESIICKLLKEKYKSNKIIEQTFFETRLNNGMKILLKKVTGKPTVGISLSYEVSQLNETVKNLGINYLTSTLLLYGNEKRNYQQFLNHCISNGINFGISPHSETTLINAKCFKETLPASLELVSDVVLHPTFPKEHFNNIKLTIKSNLDRVKDYPQHNSSLLFKEMIFGKKSNLNNRSGSKTSIQNITIKQIKEWYNKHYQPENMSLAIVGDFNFDEALRLCESNFSFEKNNYSRSIQKALINSSKTKYKLTKRGMDQAIITIGGFACNAHDKVKNTAFHILSQIIGGENDSILFTELREKRGLAYSVDFSFSSVRSTGFWVASAVVDKANKDEAVKVIRDVLKSIMTNGITLKELETTKNFIRGQRVMEQESVLNLAQTLSILESLGLGYSHYLKRDERLDRVDVKMLHELASEYFKEEDQFIHIMI